MISIELGQGHHAEHTLAGDLDTAYRNCQGVLADYRQFGFTGHFRQQAAPTTLVGELNHRDGTRLTVKLDLASRGNATGVAVRLAGTLRVDGPADSSAARMLNGDIGRALTSQGLPAAMQVIHLRSAIHACHRQASGRSSPGTSHGFAAYPGPTAFAAYPGPMLKSEPRR